MEDEPHYMDKNNKGGINFLDDEEDEEEDPNEAHFKWLILNLIYINNVQFYS